MDTEEAIRLLAEGNRIPRGHRLPYLNFFIVVDILFVLKESGELSFGNLLTKLTMLSKHNSLAKYLALMETIGLVSKTEVEYRGAVKARVFLNLTERGNAIAEVLNGLVP